MKESLWVELYRPKTVEECILPEELKKTFQSYVDRKEVPHLLLCGGAGTGKTTVARAICEEIGCDYLLINGSDENGIDTFRMKIKNYASAMSLSGGKKVIIIDDFARAVVNFEPQGIQKRAKELSNTLAGSASQADALGIALANVGLKSGGFKDQVAEVKNYALALEAATRNTERLSSVLRVLIRMISVQISLLFDTGANSIIEAGSFPTFSTASVNAT